MISLIFIVPLLALAVYFVFFRKAKVGSAYGNSPEQVSALESKIEVLRAELETSAQVVEKIEAYRKAQFEVFTSLGNNMKSLTKKLATASGEEKDLLKAEKSVTEDLYAKACTKLRAAENLLHNAKTGKRILDFAMARAGAEHSAQVALAELNEALDQTKQLPLHIGSLDFNIDEWIAQASKIKVRDQ